MYKALSFILALMLGVAGIYSFSHEAEAQQTGEIAGDYLSVTIDILADTIYQISYYICPALTACSLGNLKTICQQNPEFLNGIIMGIVVLGGVGAFFGLIIGGVLGAPLCLVGAIPFGLIGAVILGLIGALNGAPLGCCYGCADWMGLFRPTATDYAWADYYTRYPELAPEEG